MADDDKAKAEKLAAAKKRVEALKKKKQAGGAAGAAGASGKKGAKKDKAASDAKAVEDEEAEEPTAEDDKEEAAEAKEETKKETADGTDKTDKTDKTGKTDKTDKTGKTDTAAGKSDKKKGKKGAKKDDKDEEDNVDEDADKEKEDTKTDDKAEEDDIVGEPTSPKGAVPSLAEQSRLRSASFRHGGPLSPGADGETAADIYRKQASRIEELERQNKRLTKENADAEKRWQKAEDALEDIRDSTGGDSSEVSKLKSQIAALTRQNTQLQARSRHGSSPSMSVNSPPTSELETQLKSKSQTIETMELEMSRLRAQVERLSMGGAGREDDEEGGDNGSHAPKRSRQEQVAALEEKLERAEKAAGTAQRELAELKRNLDRTSEKAVREGSARTSAETKLKTLEKETEDLRTERDELTKKVDSLEKKVTTLTTLHKEHDARTQALRRDKERGDKDLAEARTRLERVEAENLRLRKSDARDGGGTDDEHLDELLASSPEASERIEQLDRRVRELEAENTNLRHGIWHERRKELQVGPDDTPGGAGGSRHFSDVDLSPLGGSGGGKKGHGGSVSGGASGALGDFFSVLTGGGGDHHGHGHHGHHGHDDDGLLDDDDDMDFDEEAFRRAQEEEARQRLERVREAKRALKNWEGWRLDLVESRQGGAEGIGPIFDI
ncbi:uncharacterized protein SPSK_05066 [Sporothrix schenckii 1099-18]|uniref:M protein repeat protein n=1 Tax=Sporothrix schenckii 1099-18 TaxID=1397361 RepID=A0A0F2LUE7_SPOSC|nr:uncharacterized protein SPSK_05066 [Sporothrix schenckii 1099-18]KJR81103.1 hypothetical protein SPSK_05066 [Sporothrix schenckii 1099-18]